MPLEGERESAILPDHRGALMFWLGVFIAKAADPFAILLAIVGGALSQTWWHIILVAVGVEMTVELVLAGINPTYRLYPLLFAMGVIGAGISAALAFSIKRWRTRRREIAISN
jgi:hypothetical protein